MNNMILGKYLSVNEKHILCIQKDSTPTNIFTAFFIMETVSISQVAKLFL